MLNDNIFSSYVNKYSDIIQLMGEYMKIDELNNVVIRSWKKETCYPPLKDKWSEDNPSVGQSAVTALIVNDFFGGKIMRCIHNDTYHYYNYLDYNRVDLTKNQFQDALTYDNQELSSREYLLSNEDTKNRYITLLKNVKENFKVYGYKEYLLFDNNKEAYKSKFPGLVTGNQKAKLYGKHNCLYTLGWKKRGGEVFNTVYFEDEDIAKEVGYRPCRECFPNEYKEWQNTLKIKYKKDRKKK